MSIFDRFKKKPKEPEKPKMIPVIMMDGSIEEYHPHFQITDGKHCIVNEGKSIYHTHFDCPKIDLSIPLHGMVIYDAEREYMEKCYNCWSWDRLDDESEDDE